MGDWHTAEFQAALSSIAERNAWHFYQTPAEALSAWPTVESGPELILLAQNLPGMLSQETLERLRLKLPLARIVVVAGSWCEGELRTGRPPAGVARLYWYELRPWWLKARRMIRDGAAPQWAAVADSVLSERRKPAHHVESAVLSGRILVDSVDYATYSTLADGLQSFGAQCFWSRARNLALETNDLRAGIWVGSQLEAEEIPTLQQFTQLVRQHGGHTIALLDFPRWEHVDIVRHCGCLGILGMPFVVEELVALLLDGK